MYDFGLVFSVLHAIPMALTREQIASIATLARLELTPEEVPLYQDSLSRII
jgi:Asp-tRNA(Asn)/Glu-tRNA(Gln) amidotransferase C subunit